MKTTREAAKEASHQQMVNDLQDLLERNYEAEKGYKKAIEHTKNTNLKHFLRDRAAQHNHFATELDKHIHLLNEHPRENGNGGALGNLQKFWMNFKNSLGKKDDEAILEECIQGEKLSIKKYEEKIRRNKFHPDIKDMLNDHLVKIREILKEVKILEDLED